MIVLCSLFTVKPCDLTLGEPWENKLETNDVFQMKKIAKESQGKYLQSDYNTKKQIRIQCSVHSDKVAGSTNLGVCNSPF